jgi:hypothetical protein
MPRKKMLFASIAFLTVLSYVNAQPDFDNDVDDVGAPIPGLLLAAIAGLVIGVRKIYHKK